jgi:hypothetical protein
MTTTTMGASVRETFRRMSFRGSDQLATTAEVRGLAYLSGAGSVFLAQVRDGVMDAAHWTLDKGRSLDDEPDADDRDAVIREAPHDDPTVRWHQYVELHAWMEDIAELGTPSADDVTETVAGVALQVIAARLFDRLWGEVREAARQDEEG